VGYVTKKVLGPLWANRKRNRQIEC